MGYYTHFTGETYRGAVSVSEDFPETWRYVPLKLTRDRTKWVNAIPYRQLAKEHNLGEFYGVDIEGNCHFKNQVVPPEGNALLRDGIPAVATKPGHGVGIFMRDSTPGLVILDCDTHLEPVTQDGVARFVVRRGRDQLLALFKRHGETVPPCPIVRGNREGHGYLIFKQNSAHPIRTRKIRPHGMALDVLGAGHQNHWTCGNRALVAGRERLDDLPELPTWLAQLIARDKPVTPRLERGAIDASGNDPWSRMFLDAVLAPVSPHGPGWNQNLFNAACTLVENGVGWERVVELIIERCEPSTPTDDLMARNSVASAWRKVTGEAVPE